MLAAQLPSWANSDNLQWIALGVIGAMLVLMFLVLVFRPRGLLEERTVQWLRQRFT